MRLSDSRYLAMVVLVAVAACGGGSAAPKPDAGVDAAPAITGLGQPCLLANNNMDCPKQTPGCLGFDGNTGMGYCSTVCVVGATMMTDAMGGITTITPDPSAPQQLAVCAAAFTAAIGEPTCTAVINWSPLDKPLMASTTYTDVAVACTVGCDATTNACPGALKCNIPVGRCEP